jgi:predicted MFS family arabinose efflux permease
MNAKRVHQVDLPRRTLRAPGTRADLAESPAVIGPVRLTYSLRPGAPLPLLMAAVAVALMFAATPFLIPEIAQRYGVSEGIAGGISIAQVGAFAATTLILPRLVSPTVRLLAVASATFLTANLVSAALSGFAFLVAVRALAGAAAGTLTWFVWSDAMRSPRSLATVSAVGPVTALIGSPLLAILSGGGDRAVYLALAVASVPGVLVRSQEPPQRQARRQVSRSRSNRVLLGALLLLTFSGASLFVYVAVAAREVLAMTPTMVSLGISLNAAGGLLGARLAARHRRPGWWLATAGPAAFLAIGGGATALFFVGMAWWGFAFWMGVPGIFQMLAQRSLEPAERAGDAQGFMAVGRALAPAMGGGFADAGAYQALAAVAGAGVMLAGVTVIGVQEGRELLPPSDPRTFVDSQS